MSDLTAEMKQELLAVASRFAGKRVAVVGDYVADVFVMGRPCRLSREAPVPILRYEGESVLPGSAGNVARNLAALGAKPVCVGAVGGDETGGRLRDELAALGADVSAMLRDGELTTCTKTRIMAGDRHRAKQQVVRIDRERTGPLPASLQDRLLAAAETAVAGVEAVLISDYGGGCVTEEMIRRAGEWAKRTLVIADSRYRILQFQGITSATPNEDEFEQAAGRTFENGQGMAEAGEALRRRLDLRALLVTRGNQGMMLCEEGRPAVHVPIVGRDDVIDVTGAGDTVAAVFALALASGASFVKAAHLANHAAGVVVMKAGTASCDQDELREIVLRDPDAPRGT